MSSDLVKRVFHFSVVGAAGVGKTSLLQRLSGKTFNRKSGHKPSVEEEAVQYSLQVSTSSGLILFHFYDWAWAEKRKDEDISRQLAKGSDGAVFVYDVTEKRSKTDFYDFNDWYERAAGFDKPWMIISNKNEQKKHSVLEGEGQALANKGNQRCYIAVSLVEDTGVDEIMLSLSRLMMKDLNLSVSAVSPATEEVMKWYHEHSSNGTSLSQGSVTKTHRVLFLVLNSSVFSKFEASLEGTHFEAVQTGSAESTEEALADTNSDGLPILAVAGAPSMTTGQQDALKILAEKHSVPCVVCIPRDIADQLHACKK